MAMPDALASSRGPSLRLLVDTQEAREKYLKLCIPLQKAAYRGDWEAISPIIEQDLALLRTAITESCATVLHIAAEANHIHLVRELVKLMHRSDLELQDKEGNTAFWLAAKHGYMQITEIMWQENINLLTITNREGVTPINMAASNGKSEMAWYLYRKAVQTFEESDWTKLFFISIDTGFYDLALELQSRRPELAFARDVNNMTGLHVLARKPSCSRCPSGACRKQNLNSCLNQNLVVQLVKCLWKEIIPLSPSRMMETIRYPSHVIFHAAEVGNLDFLVEIIRTYPEIMREVDSRNRSIIHIAVLHRRAGIFNLIHEIGPFKDFMVSRVDNVDRSNLLHLAAKLAPQYRLNVVNGDFFWLMHEQEWFKEVKRTMPPSFLEMKNSRRLTPHQLFTVEHAELMKNAESFMMRTANSCMVVSTLVATSVFSAAFSILGGNINSSGTKYLEKPSFLIFFMTGAAAFVSSSISIILFLSILISTGAEEEFFKSSSLKLIFGLIALFVSILSMMISFSSAFFLTDYYHSLKWLPSFISVLAFAPLPLFVFLHFSLWTDILYTTYSSKSLFQPSKRILF